MAQNRRRGISFAGAGRGKGYEKKKERCFYLRIPDIGGNRRASYKKGKMKKKHEKKKGR